jgi:glutathione S-transferase
MPFLLLKLITTKIATAKVPFFVRPIVKGVAKNLDASFVGPNLATHLAFLEAELGTSTWFAGDELTAADVQMSYPLEAAASRGGDAATTPNIRRVLAAMRARPAYARAIAKGGPITFDS